MRPKFIPVTLAALFFAGTAFAEGIPVEPGLWEMTTTMTMSMMPQPQINTSQECVEEETLDPAAFNMDEENPCDITDVTFESNTVKWAINCPSANGAKMEGTWEMTSNGDSLSGNGKMATEISGQAIGFEMEWEGKRIGDCE